MNRRQFMKAAAGAGTAGYMAAACASTEDLPVPQSSGPWAATPAESAHALLPEDRRPEGMLEIFCMGGMSAWETFYTAPQHGDPSSGGPFAGQQWWSFQDSHPSVPGWFETCSGGASASMPLYEPYALDAVGQTINLGPFVHPLRDRPDLLARMRVWVVAHQIEPHAVAIPLGIAGLNVSSPRMAGLGTHLQRFFAARGPADRVAPYSYAIYPSSFNPSNNGTAATALGMHPAAAQPLAVHLGPDPRLPRRLSRPGVGNYRGPMDALLDHYAASFRNRLRHKGVDLRAPGLRNYRSARDAMRKSDVLKQLLVPALFEIPDISLCMTHPSYPESTVVPDETTAAVRMARHLLLSGDRAARYVQVLDPGIVTDPNGQGYDGHGAHVVQTGANVSHVCKVLAEAVNRPGENDPAKLDLDRHFVLLNTEFGRAPIPEISPANPHGAGTNHWPWGYVVVGFGGFVDEERSGIVGAIGENSRAIEWVTPTEHRAAMLLAMGAWPFTPEAFSVAAVTGAETELGAALDLKQRVLGYES